MIYPQGVLQYYETQHIHTYKRIIKWHNIMNFNILSGRYSSQTDPTFIKIRSEKLAESLLHLNKGIGVSKVAVSRPGIGVKTCYKQERV